MRTSAAVALAVFVCASAHAATSPTKTPCPSASLVGSELGLKLGSPTSTVVAYNKTCLYKGTGPVPVKVEFQTDTPTTFALSEKAVAALGLVKLKGLGQAAWTLKSGGDLDVYRSGATIKIVAPLVPATKLEALAKKLL
jgi:hypothetical protein